MMEELIPGGIKKKNIEDYPPVTIYSCGPTVYGYAHIGNFRTFIFNDFLRRYIKFRGLKVDHAMNITDVDDKTIKGSREEGINLKEYTEKFTDIFFEDLKHLHDKCGPWDLVLFSGDLTQRGSEEAKGPRILKKCAVGAGKEGLFLGQ